MGFDFQVLDRFLHNRRVAVAVTLALAAIPVAWALGRAADQNARQWSQLNRAADAAALAAVSPNMMQQVDSVAQTAAINTFFSQASSTARLVPGSLKPSILVQTAQDGRLRSVTVHYAAQLYDVSGGSALTTPVHGSAQASRQKSPTIPSEILADAAFQ
jgi:hypothetical protein